MVSFVLPGGFGQELHFRGTARDGVPLTGTYFAGNQEFPVCDGITDFVDEKLLAPSDSESLHWYMTNAATYDDYLPITFEMLRVSEEEERRKMISALDLARGQRVLEVGCGTGRDSSLILEQIGDEGLLHLQDVSAEILSVARERFDREMSGRRVVISRAEASRLPFRDEQFDRVFHFGGLNTFGDKERAVSEMFRVTKVGGRIVIGDEGVPKWLRNTEFFKVLANANAQYSSEPPLEAIPESARNVRVEWFMGDAFYFISLEKAAGPPEGNFTVRIPGRRGGSLYSRYYGQLEGVTSLTKSKVIEAAAKEGISIHDWLERACNAALETPG